MLRALANLAIRHPGRTLLLAAAAFGICGAFGATAVGMLNVLVGGPAADFADQGAAIAATLPLAIAILAVVTLLVLWLMTGSVILPVKTLLMNAITAFPAEAAPTARNHRGCRGPAAHPDRPSLTKSSPSALTCAVLRHRSRLVQGSMVVWRSVR